MPPSLVYLSSGMKLKRPGLYSNKLVSVKGSVPVSLRGLNMFAKPTQSPLAPCASTAPAP